MQAWLPAPPHLPLCPLRATTSEVSSTTHTLLLLGLIAPLFMELTAPTSSSSHVMLFREHTLVLFLHTAETPPTVIDRD